MKPSLLLLVFLQTLIFCVCSTAKNVRETLKTVAGCSCLPTWKYGNNTYTYPNNCADPVGSGFSWCLTSKSPLPCVGSQGSTEWDKCDALSTATNTHQLPRLEEINSQPAPNKLETASGDPLLEEAISIEHVLVPAKGSLVSYISSKKQRQGGQISSRSPKRKETKADSSIIALTSSTTALEGEDERMRTALKLNLAENCICYPGRGTCDSYGKCVCIEPQRFVGSNCGECGAGFEGPNCTTAKSFLLIYVVVVVFGFGICCLLSCVLNARSRACLLKKCGIRLFRDTALNTEMKEFELDNDLFLNRKERQRWKSNKAQNKAEQFSSSSSEEEEPADDNEQPAEEVLLDFSEFDISQSCYMLQADDGESNGDIMESLNANGDFELQV